MSKRSSVKVKELHPHSRKLHQLKKQVSHRARVEKRLVARCHLDRVVADKLRWFQCHLVAGKEVYGVSEIEQLIEEFLCRGEEVSSGTHRDDMARMQVEQERHQFESSGGIQAPDLSIKRVVTNLRDWNGEVKWIQHNITMKKFSKTKP